MIRKKETINSQEWTDLSTYGDYLKHKSFEDLSSDFGIKSEEEDRKCQIWMADFIDNKGQEIEEVVELNALHWINNSSLLGNGQIYFFKNK